MCCSPQQYQKIDYQINIIFGKRLRISPDLSLAASTFSAAFCRTPPVQPSSPTSFVEGNNGPIIFPRREASSLSFFLRSLFLCALVSFCVPDSLSSLSSLAEQLLFSKSSEFYPIVKSSIKNQFFLF